MRRTLFAAALTAVVVGLSAPAAFAESNDPYTPYTPQTPTLAGSTAVSECIGDVPYIHYSIDMTDPDDIAKSHTAYLKLSDGKNVVDIRLGELGSGDELSGTLLWPGASVDADGNATGWPGWTQVDGQWVETTGNFAWTRGAITAELHVNPELPVSLSYPKASAACASPELSAEHPSLASTGGAVPYLAVGAGVAALAVGTGLVLRRRRATR